MGTSGSDAAEAVRSAFLASNRGDIEGFLRYLHPRIEWESAGVLLHPPGVAHGHEEVRSGFESRVVHFGRHPRVTLTDLRAEPPHVFVLGVVDSPNGQRLPEAWICEVRDGLVLRVAAFASPGQGSAEWERRARQPSG